MFCSEYSAGVISQSFWFVEFKKYLKLQDEGKSEDEIKDLIIQGNLFGAPNENRAKRIYGYINNRVSTLSQEEIDIFFSTDLTTQKVICLVSILRNDRFFFEFLYEVYREKHQLGVEILDPSEIRIFTAAKERQNDEVSSWTDATKKKMQAAYINFMVDANLLTVEEKNKKITPPIIDIEYEDYLVSVGEEAYIKAITGVM